MTIDDESGNPVSVEIFDLTRAGNILLRGEFQRDFKRLASPTFPLKTSFKAVFL